MPAAGSHAALWIRELRKSTIKSEEYCSSSRNKFAPPTGICRRHENVTANHEKNAIFSAWLMRRIGASGSGIEVLGRCTIPLAISDEPSDGSGTGEGAKEVSGARWTKGWASIWIAGAGAAIGSGAGGSGFRASVLGGITSRSATANCAPLVSLA